MYAVCGNPIGDIRISNALLDVKSILVYHKNKKECLHRHTPLVETNNSVLTVSFFVEDSLHYLFQFEDEKKLQKLRMFLSVNQPFSLLGIPRVSYIEILF